MACNCIEKFDELLKPRNTRLQTAFLIGRDPDHGGAGKLTLVPRIGSEQIERGRGKAKAVSVSPTFCPFCGTKYERPIAVNAVEDQARAS